MTTYRLSRAAKEDLAEITEYLRRRGSPRVAGKVLRALREAMRRVAQSPGIGHVRLDLANESVRFYRVYDYFVIYIHDSKPLWIARVLHGARDLRNLLTDL